ncbi:MAG TPA: ABC transporter permease [Thermodesulfobacteriota bacterium]|nr:ABC transporter permease [Thermodesulfobacteriota bacterium]
MLFWQVIKVAFRGILANKLRTVLTMLGIIIGVAAIIAMLSIGEGAKKQVLESISRFGTNLLRVRPGAARLGHIRTGAVETLTLEDAESLASIPGVFRISPAVGNMSQVKYANKNSTTMITGTTPQYFDINNFPVDTGRAFDSTDLKLMKRVADIGTTVKKELFGEGPAIGEEIKVEGQSFLVIGVMTSKGQTSWYDPDDQVFVPITTSQKRLFNQDFVNDIYVQVGLVDDIPRVKAEIERILRTRHRIPAGTESDFSVRDFSEFVTTMKQTSQTFAYLLSGIAAVSLLVGGIGVMNIMLVSVTERTREIGIRMAVGARRSDIMRQFLIEALVISVTGGLMGIALGVSLGFLISNLGDWETVITPYSIVLGFVFSVLVGLVFGIYPARKAAHMDPIEALRYE